MTSKSDRFLVKIKLADETKEIIETLPDLECFDGKFSIQEKLEKILSKHIKYYDCDIEGYTVKCDDYGYSLLRLEFYKPNYILEITQ